MIRVLLVDDHSIILDGVKMILELIKEIEVVGSAFNGKEAIEFLKKNTVDVVVMDLNMPVMDGVEATKIICKDYPSSKVLVLTMFKKVEFLKEVISNGASGYLLKNSASNELVKAIKTVYEGRNFFPYEVSNMLINSLRKNSDIIDDSRGDKYDTVIEFKKKVQLSKREVEIVKLLAEGNSISEIADKLFLSTHTVQSHRKNILMKLSLRNTAGLVRYALKNNLVD